MPFSVGESIDLVVDRLAYPDGQGVGRVDGFTIFVEGAAPEERVRAQITEVRPRMAFSRLVEVLSPSPARQKPPCPVFGQCGGCAWQHIEYTEQIRQKKFILQRVVEQLGQGPEVGEFVPSPSSLRYRNRIQVQAGGGRVGFFAKGTNSLIAVSDCFIAEAEVAEQIPALALKAPQPQIERWEIARQPTGGVVTRPTDSRSENSLFSQVNEGVNQLLIREVLRWARAVAPRRTLDLYSGQGNFTLPLAADLRETNLTAVEHSSFNVAICQERLASAKFDHVQVHQASVEDFLEEKSALEIDLAIVDPPRPGLTRRALTAIVEMSPSALFYISCQPMTFQRDARELLAKGYQWRFVRGFDMFPQTPHLEIFGVFTRNDFALRHLPA